ncbi:hypothetical protein [Adhaeribacter radiodurans]|uniref:Uncharacterized protein n=1 Tax=Adhaeribacter radiodurans TaxID=2745197 RepID=A0A7L7L7M2_9BACT|nr:hypothetical protein [Adhaeribacter radiodurans]QMU28369.1 hypothetical protein HUW48_10130 [Adhaeribacter radiodurans]
MQVIHSIKYNNPIILKGYIESINANTSNGIVELIHKKTKVEQRLFGIALLKSAYILAFAKFGYTFILNNVYDRLREQLLNPDKQIYPEHFWTEQSVFSKQYEGVHFLPKKGLKVFL